MLTYCIKMQVCNNAIFKYRSLLKHVCIPPENVGDRECSTRGFHTKKEENMLITYLKASKSACFICSLFCAQQMQISFLSKHFTELWGISPCLLIHLFFLISPRVNSCRAAHHGAPRAAPQHSYHKACSVYQSGFSGAKPCAFAQIGSEVELPAGLCTSPALGDMS